MFLYKNKDNKSDHHKEISILLRKCNLSALNCSNIANKLSFRKSIFTVMLPYYSIIGIINSLIPRYFQNLNTKQRDVISFWGVIISITFLVVSMQISLARYQERIKKVTSTLNKLKIIKSKLQLLESNCNKSVLDNLQKEYNEIINDYSLINRRYFYETCKIQDKKNRIKIKRRFLKEKERQLNNQLSAGEIDFDKYYDNIKSIRPIGELFDHFSVSEKIYFTVINILEYLLYIFVFTLPIFVYIFIFVVLTRFI